jgi:hypothetical protein
MIKKVISGGCMRCISTSIRPGAQQEVEIINKLAPRSPRPLTQLRPAST